MRLTCPNCEAQYEIPEAAIPDAGREVQCSACGETWMQQRPDAAQSPAPQPFADVPATPHPEPAQRRLDPDIADILRSEAARERAKRAAEATGDVQPAPEPAAAQGRMPDPDRINSSLTPARGHMAGRARQDPKPATFSAARRGFGTGFWVVVIAFALAAGVYLTAPDVIALVPDAAPTIERYVASVDGARLRLDALVGRVMAQITGG